MDLKPAATVETLNRYLDTLRLKFPGRRLKVLLGREHFLALATEDPPGFFWDTSRTPDHITYKDAIIKRNDHVDGMWFDLA